MRRTKQVIICLVGLRFKVEEYTVRQEKPDKYVRAWLIRAFGYFPVRRSRPKYWWGRTASRIVQVRGHYTVLAMSTGYSFPMLILDCPGWFRTQAEAQKVLDKIKKKKTIRVEVD